MCVECVLSLLNAASAMQRRCPLCRRQILPHEIHRIQSDALKANGGDEARGNDAEAQAKALSIAIQAAETLAASAKAQVNIDIFLFFNDCFFSICFQLTFNKIQNYRHRVLMCLLSSVNANVTAQTLQLRHCEICSQVDVLLHG